MPVYASFSRDHTPHTALWHEPLEEENVGGGAVHEVTCDSYTHITRASQRRLSISRLRERDGPLLATFSRGAIGRAKSDRVSPLTTKIMHENLPTGARLELWAGAESGSVICAPVAKHSSGRAEQRLADYSGTCYDARCRMKPRSDESGTRRCAERSRASPTMLE